MYNSYFQIFTVYEVALAVTCLLLLRLGPYAYPPHREREVLPLATEMTQ